MNKHNKTDSATKRNPALSGTGNADLRDRAVAVWEKESVDFENIPSLSPDEMRELVSELQVHRIELEMQNEELRQTQNQLEETRNKYLHLYDFAPIGYFTLDDKSAIIEANLEFCRMLGLERKAVIGKNFTRFIRKDEQDIFYLNRQRLENSGSQASCELRLVAIDNTEMNVLLESVILKNPQTETPIIRMTANDITERKKAELKLWELTQTLEQQVEDRTALAESRARQLQSLSVELIEAEERERRRLATLLHDDLQQLLAAARLQVDMACRVHPDDTALANVLNLISKSIENSRRLSHELSPPVLQSSDAAAPLQWIARFFSEQFGLHVDLTTETTLTIENEAMKVFIFRVVQELLFNVVKHSRVRTACVNLVQKDESLMLTVSDKGQGFDPAILDASARCNGLGLLSLRERVQYFGGILTIESKPGQGTCLTITIPCHILSDDPQHLSGIEEISPGEDTKTVLTDESGVTRVLFVDDHKVMRQGLINLIGDQPGIHVAGEASNGKEAIERVRQLRPDVVVMDAIMPVMDGVEATRRIKSRWPEVRVIALSMLEDEYVFRSMQDAGAEAFLSKAASSAELLKTIFGIE